jgi:hypothetical protein
MKKLGLHLEKLEIETEDFDAHDLKKLLKDHIVLKSLTLHNLRLNDDFKADEELTRNESIEILKVSGISQLSYWSKCWPSAWPIFKRFLLAMPSLKEFVLYNDKGLFYSSEEMFKNIKDILLFLGENFFN